MLFSLSNGHFHDLSISSSPSFLFFYFLKFILIYDNFFRF